MICTRWDSLATLVESRQVSLAEVHANERFWEKSDVDCRTHWQLTEPGVVGLL